MKGPNVFGGYWKRPDLNKDTFVDGWYRTGDICYANAQGHFFITDRMKELIKYSTFIPYITILGNSNILQRAFKSLPPNSKPRSSPVRTLPTSASLAS